MIRCQTLGPVLVTVDDRPAPPELLWRKHLALLVYLARAPRRTRSREQLIGLLWPDKAETAARHSLNEALRVIRRSAGESVIVSGETVRLAEADVVLDVDQFDRLATTDVAGASRLVTGEFLEGFSVPGASEFEDWLSAERRYWSERSVAVLAGYARSLALQGHPDDAVIAAGRALRIDPMAEAATDSLLRALALQGERTRALERYDQYATLLRDKLSVEPSAALQALADRIRRQPAMARRTAPPPERLSTRRRLPLVARERELDVLRQQWIQAVSTREPRIAVVLGDSGTGKTRLVEELAARVRLDAAAVAAVRAVPADQENSQSTLLALSGGLVDAPGVAAAAPAAIAALAARQPQWADRFSGSLAEDWPLSRALFEVVRAIAGEQPVLLWVDEADFLDSDSLATLETLLRDGTGLPLLVVLSAAGHAPDGSLDRLRARLGRDVQGTALRLEPLGVEDLRNLAGAALPDYLPHDLERLSRRLALDSAGLPLLAVELLHAIAAGLELNPASGLWPEPLRTLTDTLPGQLPDSISAAIRVGFRCLSAPAQRVLAAASVLGDRVSSDDLVRALELPPGLVADSLDELEWNRWLVAEPRGYTFLARIIRDVVARDMLTPGQRQRLLSFGQGPRVPSRQG